MREATLCYPVADGDVLLIEKKRGVGAGKVNGPGGKLESGEPIETPEARPVWYDIDDIPFDRMWEDDRYWVPHLLDGTPFRGHAVFDADGEHMEEWTLRTDVALDGVPAWERD